MASRATPPQAPQLICVMQMAPSLTSAASGPASSSANPSAAFQQWISIDQFLRSPCRLRTQPSAMVFLQLHCQNRVHVVLAPAPDLAAELLLDARMRAPAV